MGISNSSLSQIITLRSEAIYFYSSLFSSIPSEDIISRYLKAHELIEDLKALDPKKIKTVEFIIINSLDALGIEPWLRTNSARHPLSVKILLISYLAETSGDKNFQHRNNSFTSLGILLELCSASMILVRGLYYKFRYGLL